MMEPSSSPFDGFVRLANALAHLAAARLEAHNDQLAAIRAQFLKDRATIAGQPAPASPAP